MVLASEIVMQPPVRVTGELSTKRVAAYLKSSHKSNSIRVQRDGDGFFIADGFVAFRLPQHPDLLPFTFFALEWERATFAAKEQAASEGGPDIRALWHRWIGTDEGYERLTLTPYLWEIAGPRDRTGQLARKFAAYELTEEKYATYLDKRYCDALTPGLDELEGFLFETAGFEKPVRVAARNGYVAVIMPLVNRKEKR